MPVHTLSIEVRSLISGTDQKLIVSVPRGPCFLGCGENPFLSLVAFIKSWMISYYFTRLLKKHLNPTTNPVFVC